MNPLRLKLTVYSLFFCFQVFAQRGGEGVRVVYDRFPMIVGDEKYRKLEHILPEIVLAQMLESPYEFVRRDATNSSKRSTVNLADSIRFDFQLMAEYSITNGQFYLDPYIYDFKSHSFKYFTSEVGPLGSILDKMRMVSIEIKQYLDGYSRPSSVKKKLLAKCFNYSNKDSIARSLDLDLALGLTVNLNNKNIKIVPWSESKSWCKVKTNPHEIIQQLNVDGVITGSIQGNDAEITITPMLYVKDYPVVYLPEIIGSYDDYPALEQNLLFDVNDFLNAALVTNQWRISDLSFTSADYVDYWNKGMTYYDSSENYMSAFMFNKALSLNPKSDTLLTNLAIVRGRQGRHKEARIIYKRALDLNPFYQDAWGGLGEACYALGDYREALNAYLRLKEISPEHKGINLSIARCYLLLYEDVSAISYYRKDMAENPKSKDIGTEIGQAYFALNNYDSALYFFNQALKFNPSDTLAQRYIGSIYERKGNEYFSRGKYKDAVDLYEKAKSFSANESVYNLLLLSNNRLKRFEQSEALISEGLNLGIYDPLSVYFDQSEFLREEMYRAMDKNDNRSVSDFGARIIQTMERHLALNKNDAQAYWIMGNTNVSINNIPSGINYLEQAIARDSTDYRYILDLGEAYILGNKFEKVGPLFKRYIGKADLSARNKMIMLYLSVVAGIASGQEDQAAFGGLNEFFKNKEGIFDWSFYALEKWMNSAVGISNEQKKRINGLTSRMKDALKRGS